MTDDASAQTQKEAQPRMNVLSQYVQKLSFDNQAASRGANPSGKPTINVQVNVDTTSLQNDRHSVSLRLDVTARSEDNTVFEIALDYRGVFLLQNVPEKTVNAVLMVEAARLLFPFARRIVAETTRDGGYPPLMLDPIDFAALYRRRLSASGAVAEGANGAADGKRLELVEEA